ncbi:MAG: helix-turn-helix transcriptional regulator [Bacilli bacterium]|nr:helix-turn-helix transcriptional regulator [Bacilli bacterium]
MIGERLKKLREKQNLTQEQVGKKIGVSASTIGMYEQNRRQCDNDTLKALANFYNVTVDYLLGNDNTTKSINNIVTDKQLAEKLSVIVENENAKVLFDKIGELNDSELKQFLDIVTIIKKDDKEDK